MNEIPQIPLKDFCVGLNPRPHAFKASLQDLTARVKQNGAVEPILVRPNPNGNGKRFALVCVERRGGLGLLGTGGPDHGRSGRNI